MGFGFEFMTITKLRTAGVVVLDGRLLEGYVTAGMSAELIHDAERVPLHIKSVVLGTACPGDGVLSLTVDLCQATASLASTGDLILSTN